MSESGGFTLRLCTASREDAQRLHQWRNDPLTRQMSLDTAEIPWERHQVWFDRMIGDPDRLSFVAEAAGRPVGSIRFDRTERSADVSVVVAPGERGRGVAGSLLKAGIAAARQRWPALHRLHAVIRSQNAVSLRLFAQNGFKQVTQAAPTFQQAQAPSPPSDVTYWRLDLPPTFALNGPRPLIIAELSANHGGSVARAVDTIEAAAEAGADAIKIQTYTADTMTIASDRAEFRIRGGLWDGRTLHDLYEEAHTPWAWHAELQQAALQAGIPLFSTPFDHSAVDFLESLDVPAYKIASFEVTDLELVARVAATRKPIIMSTGMATLAEIDESVRTIRGVWQDTDPGLCLLKCVSAYPAEPRHMNLRTIVHLGQAFEAVPGLSDHTMGNTVAVAAVALGARVIEKHFTLRRSDGGPDSTFSMEPAELRALVTAIQQVTDALGSVSYGPTAAEQQSLLFRRSIFFVKDVRAGEAITRDNVRVIRPGHGLPPRALPLVLGRKAAVDRERGAPLSWDDLV